MENMNIPQHIAIIMDGNRRWAKSKNMPATYGHKEGAETLRKMVRYAKEVGIKYMTVYAFSTENWSRSESEVDTLMKLFQEYLDNFAEKASKNDIRINVIGTRERLAQRLVESIEKAMEITKNCTGITLNIALNYGARNEIVNAIKKITNGVVNNNITIEDIDEKLVSKNLYTQDIPDPDLVIRTSGELRLSNFLLWQLAYTEFLFVEKNWPEFEEKDLDYAIEEYSKRNRKYGAK